jgi:hypothetical protein
MRRTACICLFCAVCMTYTCVGAQTQEKITITTYYPSPTGVYLTLRFPPGNATQITNPRPGQIYYNDTTDGFKYYNKLGQWRDLGGGGGGYWAFDPVTQVINNTNPGPVVIGGVPEPGTGLLCKIRGNTRINAEDYGPNEDSLLYIERWNQTTGAGLVFSSATGGAAIDDYIISTRFGTPLLGISRSEWSGVSNYVVINGSRPSLAIGLDDDWEQVGNATLHVKKITRSTDDNPVVGSFTRQFNNTGREQWLSFYLYPSGWSNAYLARSSMIYACRDPNENLALAASNQTGHIRFNVGGHEASTSEVMRLTNPGGESAPDPRVGIGLTNPGHLIHLKGGAYSDGTTWTDISDRVYKREIKDMTRYGLDDILKLKPKTFIYKSDPNNKVQLGLIAQDVKTVIPEVVDGTEGQYGLSYNGLIPVLVNAIKKQQGQIESLNKEIEALKARK